MENKRLEPENGPMEKEKHLTNDPMFLGSMFFFFWGGGSKLNTIGKSHRGCSDRFLSMCLKSEFLI